MSGVYFRNHEPKAVYTVAEVNSEIRLLLESGYGGIFVEAEVGEVKRAQSGHIYFTLIDKDGRARMSAVMWRGQALRFGARLKTGALIRCFGRLTLYEAQGSFQMVVESAADEGAGKKAEALEALKRKLFEEGLFDRAKKKPLPAFPETIGVVTSRSGAAFRDIIKVLGRRFPVRILLAHAQVQGADAPNEIVAAVDRLEAKEEVDVIIIGRGGGSAEDLDAFNQESVVRRIAACRKPTISAVGHEIDTALTDLAADCRAATPSEAAEIAAPERRQVFEKLARDEDALASAMLKIIAAFERLSADATSRVRSRDPRIRLLYAGEVIAKSREVLLRKPAGMLSLCASSLAAVSGSLRRWPEPRLLKSRAALAVLDERVAASKDRILTKAAADLAERVAHLEPLSPLASLSRGYAVARRLSDGRILRSIQDAPAGTDIDVTLSEGRLLCTVTQVFPSEGMPCRK